ncbi:hypothetical protein JR316_0009078 [Psilocybe cubensis]|uniref:Uncharacterized protein n=2 Tax=Psilocybe cubensis TaxID=181762 RepID=A0ACB8GSR9_PSICU|nr:hypothetical protein JR316_0009078 [Psilocybe cubensis]KAH9478621.1 hypothetical protein JR316_0009078 [Psilocybe cubensis]
MPSALGLALTLSAWAISSVLFATLSSAQYSATYLPSNVPAKTEQGQAGTNQCGTASSQTSECQNAYINSVTDFCLFAPPSPGPDSVIGNTEVTNLKNFMRIHLILFALNFKRIEVAWCIQDGTGARLIPDGAIKGAHFVQTPDFVQVTGIGDLTLLNIPAGDGGGELDPHGADGNGNPIGGLVFSSAFGQLEQIHEWTNFVSSDEFCVRACKPGPLAATFCQHIYDVMGCAWNMPANYGEGFENCQGDSGEPMGVYGTSTFHQGEPATPSAHPIPPSSSCTPFKTIGNGLFFSGTSISVPATPTPTESSSKPSSTGSKSGTTTSPSNSLSGTSPAATSSETSPAATTPTASLSASSATRIVGWEHLTFTMGLTAASTIAAVLMV